MSVEKLSDNSRLVREKVPFTQICNNVIRHIKNGDAFLVWAYLQSKSGNWKVIKKNIKKTYGYGDGKLKKIFSYLTRANLLLYIGLRGSTGKFEHWDIKVLNGSKFDKNQPFIDEQPLVQKTARMETHTTGNDDLLNKDITKQRNELNKYSRSTEVEPNKLFFDEFWKIYPRKQKKVAAKKLWLKLKLESKGQEIINHIKKRLSSEWHGKDSQFIPLPDTFLNNQRWNDEILVNNFVQASVNVIKQNYKPYEIRSTVKEWAPGNPDYDRVNAI